MESIKGKLNSKENRMRRFYTHTHTNQRQERGQNWKCYDQFSASKFENLEEINKFREERKITRVIGEEVERPIGQ